MTLANFTQSDSIYMALVDGSSEDDLTCGVNYPYM